MRNTREEILQTALRLFAQDGYEAVSVSRIADALGITKAALYKHYASKRDIFDCLVLRMEQTDREHAAAYALPEESPPQDGAPVSLQQLVAYSKAQFRYWTVEEFSAAFRRMLTLEQYRSEEMAQMYQQYLAGGPLAYVTQLFEQMKLCAPQENAVAFFAPMFLLFSLYDRAADKDAVLRQADAHFDREERRLRAVLSEENM